MDFSLDFDACEERWKYYLIRYPDFVIDLNNVKYLRGRGKWEDGSVELSGDCFFNFNDKKTDAFRKNIKDIKHKTHKRLDNCAKNHYSNENCVLMPVTGGLNNVKGKIYYRKEGFVVAGARQYNDKCYDRPDTFIFYLNEFYEQKKSLDLDLLSAGEYLSNSIFKEALQSFNFTVLYSFLDGFETVYDFCSLFYGIDENFVNRMIEEGQKPIVNDDDLNRYMQLAEDFWKIQANIIEENKSRK